MEVSVAMSLPVSVDNGQKLISTRCRLSGLLLLVTFLRSVILTGSLGCVWLSLYLPHVLFGETAGQQHSGFSCVCCRSRKVESDGLRLIEIIVRTFLPKHTMHF